MTLEPFYWILVGAGLGIMGTLSYLALQRWVDGRPRRMEYDSTLERLRRL